MSEKEIEERWLFKNIYMNLVNLSGERVEEGCTHLPRSFSPHCAFWNKDNVLPYIPWYENRRPVKAVAVSFTTNGLEPSANGLLWYDVNGKLSHITGDVTISEME